MAPDVASALAKLGDRERYTGDDDFVFAGEAGLPLDGDALSSRYRDALARAGLRPLRFHDLRHTFGTRMIAKADIRRVQEWMGHADIQTTMKYLHYAPRERTRSWSRGRSSPDQPARHGQDLAARLEPVAPGVPLLDLLQSPMS